MPLVRVGAPAEIPEGQVAEIEIEDRPYAICRTEGKLYALGGICPHAGGRLGHGALHGHYLSCPWHGWEFDCRSGYHDESGVISVPTYAVVERDGDLLLDTTEREPRA